MKLKACRRSKILDDTYLSFLNQFYKTLRIFNYIFTYSDIFLIYISSSFLSHFVEYFLGLINKFLIDFFPQMCFDKFVPPFFFRYTEAFLSTNVIERNVEILTINVSLSL